MGKITFILGGIKSGKTDFAVKLAKKYKNVIYFATAIPRDKELIEKVKRHKARRPRRFKTIEEPKNLYKAVSKSATVILDCVNFWLNNVILEMKDDGILKCVENFMKRAKNTSSDYFIVSNEVGQCLVSHTKLGRRFQNLLGKINQIIAKNSDAVYFMVSGIPLKVK